MPGELTDEAWHRLRSYADRVVVVVKPSKLPHEEDSAEEWLITSDGAAWEPEWLVRQVESIALEFEQDGRTVAAEHVIDAREHRFSWGADAATYEVIMWLISWAATSASWDLFKLLAQRMAGKLEHNEPFSGHLTDEEAQERAKWFIEARYKDPHDQLRVTSVELVEATHASVELVGLSGWRYEVNLWVESGVVTVGRVKRLRE